MGEDIHQQTETRETIRYSSYQLYPEMWPFSKWEFIVGNFDFYESHHILIHSQVMYISNFSRARLPVVMAE